MPCHAGMDSKPLIVKLDQLVEDVLVQMDKKCVDHAILINADGAYEGLFSRAFLLRSLLPVSVKVDGGALVNLSAAPGIAQRLKKHFLCRLKNLLIAAVRP